MKKIIPYNPYFPSYFKEYVNLTQQIVDDAKSIEDFLLYFKPNYHILNAPTQVIHTSNWEEVDQEKLSEDELKAIWVSDGESEGIPYCIPSKLNYRQGYFNPYYSAYCKIGGKFITFPVASTILSRRWVHVGTHDSLNINYDTIESFIFIAQKTSDGYLMFSDQNGLVFKLEEDFARTIGTNQLLILDLIPTRYFSVREWKWTTNTHELIIPNRTIDRRKVITSEILNKREHAWNNAYPLMHEVELQIEDENNSNKFLIEKVFYDEEINIAETRSGELMQTLYYIKHIDEQPSTGILSKPAQEGNTKTSVNFY